MTTPALPKGPFLVLRQVEGDRWCVVRQRVEGGKRVFDARIATARPYSTACWAALDAAKAQCLPLGIEASGARLRRFDPKLDGPAVAK